VNTAEYVTRIGRDDMLARYIKEGSAVVGHGGDPLHQRLNVSVTSGQILRCREDCDGRKV
jgi:hypothetical protein